MTMKLLTEEIKKNLPALYSQENNPDPQVHVKFFCAWNQWTWFVTEGEPAEHDPNDYLFFGYVVGQEEEMGYFCLSELESVKGPGGLKIERDLYTKLGTLSQVLGKRATV